MGPEKPASGKKAASERDGHKYPDVVSRSIMSSDADETTGGSKPKRLQGGDDLEAFVTEHDVALVEFYTKGCAVCGSMEPVLGTVAKVSDVPIGMVNPGDDVGLLDEFVIKSVPALMLFVDGEAVAQRADGFVGVDGVLEFIEENEPER
jgi:thioredoxin-like negative regulator of GroEL